MKNKLIVVAGPTAVGKTQYAIDLAKKNNGEIVSLDSIQIYKYLNIGSAKPTIEEMQGIRHYMIDEIEPNVNFNVKQFKDMANHYIERILSDGKLPILVGGTGFYIRAVLYDTEFLEEDEIEVEKTRQKLYEELDSNGIEYLYDRLKKIDRASADTIPMENARRVIRAIEFYNLHGYPISKHNEMEKKKDSKYDYKFYVLNMDREKLYEKINKRVDNMIGAGLLQEVKKLIEMGIGKDTNAMRSIGYSELYDFCNTHDLIEDLSLIDGNEKKKLCDIISLIKQHSRNYAKRQITWFKAQKNITWVNI